jgi:hypothetical protein
MIQKLLNKILILLLEHVGYKAKARKFIKKVAIDEDLYAYLLDLLQEDEKKLHTSMFCGDLDKTHNRDMQEVLKKLIKEYGFSY